MSYRIVTNNPQVKAKYEEILFIDGGFKDVLIKVRDLVHEGHELINHPLAASLRMLFSPYRSIIIGDDNNDINNFHIEAIENSIENYKKHMGVRNPDVENGEDYAFIDSELLKSALEEFKRLNNN